MKDFYWLVIFSTIIFSCEPESEKINGSQGLQLRFSADTVLFDTLLTTRASITRRFRIFNPNEEAIQVSNIRLGNGRRSAYSLVINGRDDEELTDEVIFGGDSIMVLVRVDIDPEDQNLPYLVKDSVIVEWNNNATHVKLVAWGQDAHYVNAASICDEVWTADRPYVIFNYAFIDPDCSLTIEPGTRIYLDNGASLFVQGTLNIQGDTANRVTVRNTRFDNRYEQAPGQWGGIIFLETSENNIISHADIENGDIGIGVGYSLYESEGQVFLLPESDPDRTAQVSIDHTSVRHMSTAGILAFSSDVYAYNTEVYNTGGYLVGNFAGGTYRYEHCTFSNQPSFFINDDPTVQFSDNLILTDTETLSGDLSVSVVNSIIWDSSEEGLLINNGAERQVTADLVSNIIRLPEDFESEFFDVEANYLSSERDFPGFINSQEFDYQLDSLAFARDKGVDIGITTDLKGEPRDDQPDIGAFERIDKP